jgi:hypothetical protein
MVLKKQLKLPSLRLETKKILGRVKYQNIRVTIKGRCIK